MTDSPPSPTDPPAANAGARPLDLGPRLLNLVLPGAGLIAVGRDWPGALLALLFALCGNVALAGGLIAPAAIPAWLSVLAAALAGLAWLAAQWLLRH